MNISVVVPNYNDLRIARALQTVRMQSYTDLEVIVVHGGPMSEEFNRIYETFKVDKLIIEKDKGIFDALNKGVQSATGDTIYLMGSDDYLSDSVVFKDAVKLFDQNPDINGVCMGCVFVKSSDTVIRKWYPRKVSSMRIKCGIFPPHFSLMLKRELYEEIGLFKYVETANVATDIIWLMDLAVQKPDFQILTMNQHHLKMEYGGASTGSWRAVWNQFKVVHKYAVSCRSHLPLWFFFSLIRTGSKLFQLRF
jgi:glycosyltransferase involved in cell wall biosynthesis